ncbi:MAG: hypothetical protein KJN99_00640, partial [Marinicaulis sp.]|nr:hypothetical protein [Marinicaulis sp.]
LGIPRDDFFEFGSVKRDGDETPPELHEKHAEYLLEIFDTIARDYSRAVLRYWDWDGNPRIAFITRLLGLSDDDVE